MKNKRMVTSQTKSRLYVIVGFSLVILVLSSTEIGYVPISESHSLDLSIVPAIFAAMIGGYRAGILLAVIWTLISYHNPASHIQLLSLWESMIVQCVLLVSAVWFYEWFKKNHPSSWNVYCAIVAAVLSKNVLVNLLYISSVNQLPGSWLKYNLQEGVLELALCLLSMSLAMKHLRQIHLLNEAKQQEQKKQAEEAIHYARIKLTASVVNRHPKIGYKNIYGRSTEKL